MAKALNKAELVKSLAQKTSELTNALEKVKQAEETIGKLTVQISDKDISIGALNRRLNRLDVEMQKMRDYIVLLKNQIKGKENKVLSENTRSSSSVDSKNNEAEKKKNIEKKDESTSNQEICTSEKDHSRSGESCYSSQQHNLQADKQCTTETRSGGNRRSGSTDTLYGDKICCRRYVQESARLQKDGTESYCKKRDRSRSRDRRDDDYRNNREFSDSHPYREERKDHESRRDKYNQRSHCDRRGPSPGDRRKPSLDKSSCSRGDLGSHSDDNNFYRSYSTKDTNHARDYDHSSSYYNSNKNYVNHNEDHVHLRQEPYRSNHSDYSGYHDDSPNRSHGSNLYKNAYYGNHFVNSNSGHNFQRQSNPYAVPGQSIEVEKDVYTETQFDIMKKMSATAIAEAAKEIFQPFSHLPSPLPPQPLITPQATHGYYTNMFPLGAFASSYYVP